MKKLLIFIGLVMCLMFTTASASEEVTVTIPDYEVRIGNSSIYYYDSVYPFISYKDVTYFPMTFEYCKVLDLAISWDEGRGLYIAYQPSYAHVNVPIYDTTVNQKINKATLPEYPVYINGELISNFAEEYPILNFRGVTYFPMTWKYGNEEFAWNIIWENNILTFGSGRNPDTNLYFENIFEDGAVISAVTTYDIELPGGAHTSDTVVKYLKYDFESDKLVDTEYDPNAEENIFKYTSAETEIRDNVCYFNGQPLPEIFVVTMDYDDGREEQVVAVDHTTNTVYTNKDKITSVENNLSGRGYTLSGVQFYDFTNNYRIHYETGMMSLGRPTFTYVEHNGELLYIGKDVFASEASLCKDGNIYFNIREQVKTIRTRTSLKHELYRITPEGEIKNMTEEFPDYNSMEILATINGVMYLRNTWCPESFAEDGYTVSAVNDGYYSYGGVGEQLIKQANYVYADESFVSPKGKIYALIRWKEEIKKLN